MSDFDIDWDMEDGLQVDHDGGIDMAADHQGYVLDHQVDETADHTDISDISDISDGTGSIDAEAEIGYGDGDGDHYIDETDLPEFTFDPSFVDGSYDMLGADPDEEDLWSQLMLDMNDEVNPYAAN